MTAVNGERPVRTPPRLLIKTFWRLHRTAHRLTAGRFGLARPEAGARFGMMRLATVGRRSGKVRTAIVGYYEDGPNLVTLAMNGWGASDPAWWLNLQANPETTVVLTDGPRRMRARAAIGEERERLWLQFRDYPGWGDDINALASGRPAQTTVVVFEPLPTEPRAGNPAADPAGAPSSGGVDEAGAAGAAPMAAVPEHFDPPRRLRLRHLWLVPGLAIAVYASTQAEGLGVGIVPLLVFSILPDLPRLLGIGQRHAPGQMAARVVPLFNLLHHPLPPLAMLALAVAGALPSVALAGALAWLGHLVLGLGIGDRLRTRDGRLRSHWLVDLGPARPGRQVGAIDPGPVASAR